MTEYINLEEFKQSLGVLAEMPDIAKSIQKARKVQLELCMSCAKGRTKEEVDYAIDSQLKKFVENSHKETLYKEDEELQGYIIGRTVFYFGKEAK